MKKKQLKSESVSRNNVEKAIHELDQKFITSFKRLEVMSTNISLELFQVDKRLSSLEKNVATKDDIRVVIDTIDGFVKRINTQENRSWSNLHRIEVMEPKVEDHEKRVSALETK